MATDDQRLASLRAASAGTAYARVTQVVTLTVAGNTTIKGSVNLPAGAILRGFDTFTPVAITGSPTHTYIRAGLTDGGQDYVADTDVKAAGKVILTIVTSIDPVAGFAAPTTVFYQLTTSGGTSSAGPVEILVDYNVPAY